MILLIRSFRHWPCHQTRNPTRPQWLASWSTKTITFWSIQIMPKKFHKSWIQEIPTYKLSIGVKCIEVSKFRIFSWNGILTQIAESLSLSNSLELERSSEVLPNVLSGSFSQISLVFIRRLLDWFKEDWCAFRWKIEGEEEKGVVKFWEGWWWKCWRRNIFFRRWLVNVFLLQLIPEPSGILKLMKKSFDALSAKEGVSTVEIWLEVQRKLRRLSHFQARCGHGRFLTRVVLKSHV